MADLGLLGGLAEGLKSGIAAYKSERDAAIERAFKEKMLKYHEASAGADFYDKTGSMPRGYFSPEVEKSVLGDQKPTLAQSAELQSQQRPQEVSDQGGSTQAGSAQLTTQPQVAGSGLMTDSKPGLIHEPAQVQANPQSGYDIFTRQLNTPGIPKQLRDLAHQAAQMNAQAYGKGVSYKVDPDRRMIVPVKSEMSPEHKLEIQGKEATVKNQNLEPYFKLRDKYEGNEVKQNTDFAAEAYHKVARLYENPDPKGDQMFAINLIKLDMGKQAARENTIEEMRHNPQVVSRWGDVLSQAATGKLSDQTRASMMRTATQLYAATRDSLKDHQDAIRSEAKQLGVNNPEFLSDKPYKKADEAYARLSKSIGSYVPPTEKGGVSGMASRALQWGGKMTGLLPNQANASTISSDDRRAIDFAVKHKDDIGEQGDLARTILKGHGIKY